MFTLTTGTSHLHTFNIFPEWLAEKPLGALATTVITAVFHWMRSSSGPTNYKQCLHLSE